MKGETCVGLATLATILLILAIKLAVIGVVIWGVIKLVLHFTGA
jgi:hypothetical protein